MNIKAFFVDALQSALDLGIAVPDDVMRHVTPDVLAASLPRPLWARLLTACVGAPRVDATLVVETIGVPNLCEHVPLHVIWACIEELAVRSLGGVVATPSARTRPPLSTPPPPPPTTEPKLAAQAGGLGPNIPTPAPGAPSATAVITAGNPGEAESDGASRARVPVGQRFRPSNTGIGRLAAAGGARRPQAQATPPSPPAADPSADRNSGNALPRAKRKETDADFDLETYVGGKDDWKSSLAVEDEQLVDWAASDETASGVDEANRKR